MLREDDNETPLQHSFYFIHSIAVLIFSLFAYTSCFVNIIFIV